MKRTYIIVLAVLVIIVTGGALAVGLTGKPAAGNCHGVSGIKNYHITIENSKASQTSTSGKLCDTLTFTNADSTQREIAFGPHEHHVPYDGVEERFLSKGQSFTITFDATGTYHWHDHLHDEINGNFTVTH